MISIEAQARLEQMRARDDKERGRRLTDQERLENLRRAIVRICVDCGAEVEPGARCQCGTMN